ncbi:hypothetical protein [Shewanella sp. TC10]|uniref:hypothetical protein n=1 Tax=Shewanella sp. TC10 TaxID=1419739 RepID=UPI00129DAC3A|nr:hypothetical protein [Shewanella sp. TC10]
MTKAEALSFANANFNEQFTNRNTHFAKENATKPVWWLEIPIEKIHDSTHSEIHLLLNKDGSLFWLRVSTSFLRNHQSGFKIRSDKSVICLELDTSTFKNDVGSEKLSFFQFLQN